MGYQCDMIEKLEIRKLTTLVNQGTQLPAVVIQPYVRLFNILGPSFKL